jgi:hypothetical protein
MSTNIKPSFPHSQYFTGYGAPIISYTCTKGGGGVVRIQWAKKGIRSQKKIQNWKIIYVYHLNHGNHGKLFLFHSYECQGIETKFQFKTFQSEHLLRYKESILQRTIKRTHIINKNWWEKNKEDKDLLATFKKIHTLKYVKF